MASSTCSMRYTHRGANPTSVPLEPRGLCLPSAELWQYFARIVKVLRVLHHPHAAVGSCHRWFRVAHRSFPPVSNSLASPPRRPCPRRSSGLPFQKANKTARPLPSVVLCGRGRAPPRSALVLIQRTLLRVRPVMSSCPGFCFGLSCDLNSHLFDAEPSGPGEADNGER